jgi:hypothetical protein
MLLQQLEIRHVRVQLIGVGTEGFDMDTTDLHVVLLRKWCALWCALTEVILTTFPWSFECVLQALLSGAAAGIESDAGTRRLAGLERSSAVRPYDRLAVLALAEPAHERISNNDEGENEKYQRGVAQRHQQPAFVKQLHGGPFAVV